ncbi:hypothetical protein BLNAU_16220 [Blattamonas nauphoetae]|uniref:Right handed beta helix domain-containing protein n=1 Tax=Blattamonas nauphoetae TaxID=2049346 RepID=A0ABQ9X8I8_9EUKA|nr:hypothetical protein BLNAU_16220 [Blattamonas nauphoetae]
MHSSEGVVFQQVHHLYTVLTCPLVELHNGGAALRTNTFENGSRFACSLFDFKNGSQDEYRKVMEVQDSIFSGITMTAATPLLACGHIRRIEDLNNTYEMIKFAISPSTQSNLGSALSATPLRSVMTGANITECDGPLNGGIFFFLQCAEATFTDVTVIQCTNVVSGLVFTPDEVTHISVIKSTFWSCTTTRDTPHGSALFINHSATLSVSLATFTNNTASNCGGAIYVSARCQWVNITSSSFLNNQAPYGGAIGVGGKPTAAEGGWVIQQCQFANVGRSGTDVYFDDMSALGLTERAFAGCVSRSKSPRVFDFKSRTGYDWTNRQ